MKKIWSLMKHCVTVLHCEKGKNVNKEHLMTLWAEMADEKNN